MQEEENAVEHLTSAYENGFNPFATGCHVLIGDGLKGHDEKIVPIDGKHIKEAKIGRAIMDANVFISLTHFKGHENTGFGGTLKILEWVQVHVAEKWKCITLESHK